MTSSIPTHTLAMAAVALLATLILAGLLTPRHWWRRPTAANAAVLAGGTWAIAATLLHFFPASEQPMPIGRVAIRAPAIAAAGGAYRVSDALNLRASHGTASARIGVVPAGATIHATGKRVGDWWQLRAVVDGRPLTGWSNSLWLRRTDEAGMHVDVQEHAN